MRQRLLREIDLFLFDLHFCQRHSSTSVHLHRKRRVAGPASELVSRRRGGDVTQEEPGSSADERVLAPRSALWDLKRVKLHSILAFEVCPQLPRVPTCVSGGVRAGLMLVSRECCRVYLTGVASAHAAPREDMSNGKDPNAVQKWVWSNIYSSVCANKRSVKN